MTKRDRIIVEKAIRILSQVGRNQIGYVGACNYREHQEEAQEKMERAEQAALDSISEVMCMQEVNQVTGDLIIQEKYKLIDNKLIAEVVRDVFERL